MAGDHQEIPITELPIQHLNQLNQQIESEIEFMSASLQQLKEIQSKFVQSQDSLGKVNQDSLGKDVLVPLTSSMYINGQLDDVEIVLVDIGTGYYVEKTVGNAKAYFKKKVGYLTKQMEKIQPLLQEKYKMKQAVMEALQGKVQAQMAAQAATKST